MSQSPTIRQIAAIAGVSSATVSRALRNDSQNSQKTCKRIQKLAAELGYTPNPMVSALMGNRVRLRKSSDQQIIAYLHTNKKADEWKSYAKIIANKKDVWATHSTLIDFFKGALERASKSGYQIEEFWLREKGMDSRKMSDILFHRGIHGIVLAPLSIPKGHMSLKWDRFCTAALGYSLVRPLVHRAASDNLSAIRMAIRHLQKLGYRRITLVVDRAQDKRTNNAWTAGFSEYNAFFVRRHSDRLTPYFYSGSANPGRKFLKWLETQRPDAIISGGLCVTTWMEEAQLTTPKDFGFVLLDRPLEASTYSGIYFNGSAVGAAAIDLITGQIQRNERGLPELPRTTTIQGQWIDGETLRPA